MNQSTQLHHNIVSILTVLFEKEEAHLAKRENSMISKHIQMGGSSDGFRHIGQIYTQLTGAYKSRGKFDRLHSSLAAEMGAITTDRKILALDKDRIRQAFALVLRDAHSLQDIRDALPNCVKDLIPGCALMERTRPEAFTLADNPRAHAQYMKLREKIEFYVASRLLY